MYRLDRQNTWVAIGQQRRQETKQRPLRIICYRFDGLPSAATRDENCSRSNLKSCTIEVMMPATVWTINIYLDMDRTLKHWIRKRWAERDKVTRVNNDTLLSTTTRLCWWLAFVKQSTIYCSFSPDSAKRIRAYSMDVSWVCICFYTFWSEVTSDISNTLTNSLPEQNLFQESYI